MLVDVMPASKHRHCCMHILNSFRKKFKGVSLREQFWKCAKTPNIFLFAYEMEQMKTMDIDAYQWLSEEHPRHWTRSHFREGVKCDILSNNLSESFNNAILEGRE